MVCEYCAWLGRSLAKLASLTRTMLGLLDLFSLRLTGSLALQSSLRSHGPNLTLLRTCMGVSTCWFALLWLVCEYCAWLARSRSLFCSYGLNVVCVICVDCAWLASLVPTELELRLVCDDCELALRLYARFSFPDLLGVSNSITRFSGSFCLVCVLC